MGLSPTIASLRTRTARLERTNRRLGRNTDEDFDPARYDWYAESCPCGAEPGTCKSHHRARPNQRPPEGDWRTWLALAGRGFGKTRVGAEWIRAAAESGRVRRMALVGPTAADVRDTMIEGESGVLAVCRPDRRPVYEPSKRRVTWPNGAIATAFSADEPERLRGPQHELAWCDELASWRRPDAWSNLLFGLRLGERPRVLVTTTPRPTDLIRGLIADARTAIVKGSTYDNRLHLAADFFDQVVAAYEGSRLGQQEIHAEVLEVSEGAWFGRFDPVRHIRAEAEYHPAWPVHLAIDCGVSRHVAAVWFQVHPHADPLRRKITVFADQHIEGSYSAEAAQKILDRSRELPCGGRLDTVRLDPASSARTGIGPAARGEFERIFGSRVLSAWPLHRVADGLDQIEVMLDQGLLLLHERCASLKSAFQNYSRAKRGGQWLDEPAESQHPHEDLMDALRGGIRDRFPEGRKPELAVTYRRI